MMSYLWLNVGVAVLSFGLTWAFRRYALRVVLLDVPNERSSHERSTPRGGGLAIVVSFLVAALILWNQGLVESSLALAILAAGGLTASIGLLDDHRHIAVGWRLSVHVLSAAGAVWLLRNEIIAPWSDAPVVWHWCGYILAAVSAAWFLNLFNFMDGIDGLASVEAITICASGAALHYFAAPDGHSWLLPLLLGSSVVGFFYWNFPTARIFMGDVGSGFLGIAISCIFLYSLKYGASLFWAWLILPGVFVVDATTAVARRLLRGDRVTEAHRSHAYQHLARRFSAHGPVTIGVGLVNVAWLLPMALLVGLDYLNAFVAVPLSYAPLIWLALRYESGTD